MLSLLDCGLRVQNFDPKRHQVVFLNKTHKLTIVIVVLINTQEAEDPSRHDCKIVDWDIKPQNKHTHYFKNLFNRLCIQVKVKGHIPDKPPTSIFFRFLASKTTTVSFPAVGTYRREKQISPSLFSYCEKNQTSSPRVTIAHLRVNKYSHWTKWMLLSFFVSRAANSAVQGQIWL